jgi:hypothetical protein
MQRLPDQSNIVREDRADDEPRRPHVIVRHRRDLVHPGPQLGRVVGRQATSLNRFVVVVLGQQQQLVVLALALDLGLLPFDRIPSLNVAPKLLDRRPVHALDVHDVHNERNGQAHSCEEHHRATSIEEQACSAPEASSVRNDPGLQRLPLSRQQALRGLLCALPPPAPCCRLRPAAFAAALPLLLPRRFFLRGCSPPAAFLRLQLLFSLPESGRLLLSLLRPQLLFSLPESGRLLLFHTQPHHLRPAALLR